MAQGQVASGSPYRPEMDGPSHENTYSAFAHFTTVTTVFVLTIVVALAVGGVKHAWLSSGLMVIVSLVATAVGLFSKSLSWRPPGVVLAILLLMLLLY